MISEQQQEQASLYALGALPEAEARAFEVELRGNAELVDLVLSLQRAAGLLALSAPPVKPPPGLRNKVLQRIDEIATGNKSAPPAPSIAKMPHTIAASSDHFHPIDSQYENLSPPADYPPASSPQSHAPLFQGHDHGPRSAAPGVESYSVDRLGCHGPGSFAIRSR